MKNIMNFCFNLKRAEKVNGEAVSLMLYVNAMSLSYICNELTFFLSSSSLQMKSDPT